MKFSDEYIDKKFRDKERRIFIKTVKTKLKSLPRWAKVVFAARSARRFLPLYISNWSGSIPEEELSNNLSDLKKLISVAELSAAKTTYASDISQDKWNSYISPLVVEAMSAFHAIEAAYIAAGNKSDYSKSLDETVLHQMALCNNNSLDCDIDKLRGGILDDLKFLLNETNNNNWTDETPVSIEVFGDIW